MPLLWLEEGEIIYIYSKLLYFTRNLFFKCVSYISAPLLITKRPWSLVLYTDVKQGWLSKGASSLFNEGRKVKLWIIRSKSVCERFYVQISYGVLWWNQYYDWKHFAVYIFKINSNRPLLGWVLLTHVPVFTASDPSVCQQQNTGHHTMEFFEMCAALITQLARWVWLVHTL